MSDNLMPLKKNAPPSLSRTTALKICLIYGILGALWILLSDRIVDNSGLAVSLITLIHTAKGWLFVFVTTLLLYFLINKYVHSIDQSQQALRENEEKYRILLDESSDPIFTFYSDGQYRYVNKAFAAGVGRNVDDIIGKRIWDVFPKEEADKRFGALKGVFERGEVKVIEVLVPRPDGDRYYITTIKPIKNERQEVAYVICISKEITEFKKAQEELKKSEERYRRIYEEAIEGIFQSTPDGRFLSVNPSMARMCGYESPEEMVADIQDMVRQHYVVSEEREHFLSVMYDQGRIEGFEHQVYRKDGSKIWISVNVRAVRDGQGNILYFEGTNQDVTWRKEGEEERQRLQERLHRAEKMEAMGTLAGGVAHDLNNVLGVLVGYSELLLLEVPESSPLRRHVKSIMQSGERASAIIQDLLTLARRSVPISEVVNLNEILSRYAGTPEFDRLRAYHPGVTFRLEQADGLLNLKGSPVHLEKTIMNLLSNAAEAIPETGSVTIRTENRYLENRIQGYDDMAEGEYVVLTVSDSGKGISQEDINKIFEPFYTKKAMGRSGTGLGLAVVWGTVKDHNGYIDVKSEEGNGSVFTLYFPITREQPSMAREAVLPSAYLGHGESILVVDDVKEQRELAVSMFQRLGYSAVAVSSGEEALDFLRQEKIDLVVLDMIMDPGIDGLETYKRILDIHPKQKAIIVSGFSETQRVRKAQELGAGAYIRKPYIMETLGTAVKKEIEKDR